MICPNCGKTVPDDEMFCEYCKTPLKKSKQKSFVVNIPDDDFLPFEIAQEKADEISGESQAQTENDEAEVQAEAPDEEAEVQNTPAEQDTEPAEISAESDSATGNDIENTAAEADKAAVEEAVPVQAEEKAVKGKRKSKKKDKNRKTYIAIKLIASLCFVLIAALAVIGKMTDVFEYDPNKTVALSGLSSEQETDFESYAKKLSPLFENGYNSETAVLDDLLKIMKPDSANGLYASFFDKKDAAEDKSDPLDRFESYCKVDEADVGKIASALGISAYHNANDVNYYYYDKAYYFAESNDEPESKDTVLKVDDSKKTQDGNYYITCGLYSGTSETPSSTKYMLVSLKTAESGKNTWTVLTVSDEPLFNKESDEVTSTGENTNEAPAKITSLDYKMQRQKITVKTTKGVTYAVYAIEYPVFDSEGITQNEINSIYNEIIDSFKAQTSKADELYEDYIEDGGSKDDLPLYTHITAKVTYNDDGYFSMLERRTEYNPEADGDDNETNPTEAEPQALKLPETSYEGYTFIIESGDFVKKDDILGKDYIDLQKQLYEAYQESHNSSDETPSSDTEGIGNAIYSSPWVITDDSVLFCYKNADGALDVVELEYSKLNGTLKIK